MNINRKLFLLALAFVWITLPGNAGLTCTTTLEGGTIAGATFGPADSPVCVTGDLGLSLVTFEAGTTVLIDGPYAINVLTTINVAGTEESPVVFTAFNPSVRWRGLKFANTPPGSILNYCDISLSSDSGLTLNNSVPQIANCTIHNNQAINGAGIRISHNLPQQELLILDSKIVENVAAPGGVNCMIQGPGRGSGGGIHAIVSAGQVRIVGSRVSRNQAGFIGVNGLRSGGGIYVSGAMEIDNTLISDNTVHSSGCPCLPAAITLTAPGAGVYGSGDVAISNSVVRANHSSASVCFTGSGVAAGPAVYFNGGTLNMTNTTVDANTSAGNGPLNTTLERSAVVIAAGDASIISSTIVDNASSAIYQRGSSTVELRNSIAYFNGGAQFAGTVSANFSNISGGGGNNNNIDFNPALSNRYDRPIVLGSPSTDAGDPGSLYNDLCFPPSLGTALSDQGAHSGPGACAFIDDDADDVPNLADNCTAVANNGQQDTDNDGFGNACDSDFNQDCVVNFADVNEFAEAFLSTNPLFDLNGDGQVNFGDLSRISALFLLAPGPGLGEGFCES